MLYVSKRTDYALMALAFLAERPGRVASAREIASAAGLPGALLMNILKTLQQHRVVSSSRGVKGGYRVSDELHRVSLWDLMGMLEVNGADEGHDCCDTVTRYKITRAAQHKPVLALQYKLIGFLEKVKLSDLVLPGRRIDVPVELVGVNERSERNNRSAEADPTLEPVASGA
jgi:Rrf2 family protein